MNEVKFKKEPTLNPLTHSFALIGNNLVIKQLEYMTGDKVDVLQDPIMKYLQKIKGMPKQTKLEKPDADIPAEFVSNPVQKHIMLQISKKLKIKKSFSVFKPGDDPFLFTSC